MTPDVPASFMTSAKVSTRAGTSRLSGEAGRRLDEAAELLALGISRACARRTEAQSRESSTGLRAKTERVLVPENGP